MKRLLLIPLVALALSACDVTPRADVVILGDSNVALSAPEVIIQSQYRERGYEVQFEAVPGLSFADQEAYWTPRILSTLDDENPDFVIVNLGTNDILRPTDARTDPAPYVDAVIDGIRSVTNAHIVVVVPRDPNNSPLTKYLRGLAAPDITVLDFLSSWDSAMFDDVHFTETGNKAYAKALIAALDSL